MTPLYEKAVALWQQKEIQNDADLSEILSSYLILFAYHSCKIENKSITYDDTREIFEHDCVVSYTGDLRTLFEIHNAREAHELFLTALGERRTLDETFLKELHRCLTQDTYDARRWHSGERPGEYKRHSYIIGKAEIGALPKYVHNEVSELLGDIHDIEDKDALRAAALFHARLENIHPFADGNGRTGRLAMNYFLVMHNHPPIIIHEEDRKDYYAALDIWDSKWMIKPLWDFLKQQTGKTWQKMIQHMERRLTGSD